MRFMKLLASLKWIANRNFRMMGKKTRNHSELSTHIKLIEMTVQRNQNLIKFQSMEIYQ